MSGLLTYVIHAPALRQIAFVVALALPALVAIVTDRALRHSGRSGR